MSWEYYQDQRDDYQVKYDYDLGKHYERLIYERLNLPKFWVNSEDAFKKSSIYTPDCFVQIRGIFRPLEIKYSRVELDYVELKQNQADKLAEIGGLYLQSTPTKYVILSAKDVVDRCVIVGGYCHKPCYRYNDPLWITWKTKLILAT